MALLWVEHFGEWSEARFAEIGAGYYGSSDNSDGNGDDDSDGSGG